MVINYKSLVLWIVFLCSIQFIPAELILPEDGAHLQYTHVAFEWEQEGDAVNYQLQIAEAVDTEFENPVVDVTDSTLITIVTDGLEWEHSYLWRIRSLYEDGNSSDWISTKSFSIGSFIDYSISTTIHDSLSYYPGYTLFGTPGPLMRTSWMIDMDGNVIWASDSIPFISLSGFLPNGNMLGMYFNPDEGISGYEGKTAVEYTVDNEISWSSPDSLPVHHDVIKLTNGNYMVLIYEYQDGPIPLGSWTTNFQEIGFLADGITNEFPWEGDRIVELDGVSGEVVWSWSVFDHFSMEDFDSLGGGWVTALEFFKFDWTHCNSIYFDEEENTILLSSRHLSRITKIDYTTGEIIWNMGRQMSSGDVEFGTDLCFSYQHNVSKLDGGNLLLLDNGNNSVFYCDTEYHTTRALEIGISESGGIFSAEIEWEHVLPEDLAGRFMGSVERLPNGNTLFTPGGITPGILGKAFEVTQENEVAWEMDISTVMLRVFRTPGLHTQKFCVIQPNWAWFYPDPWIFLPLGENTVTYSIFNEGTIPETYEYDFQDNGNWFEDVTGVIEISPGESATLNFTGFVFNEIYPHTLSLSVTPTQAPNTTKSVEIEAWSTTLGNTNPEFPNEFIFKSPYPNPFNSSTILEFYLSEPSKIDMTIFDLNGRMVEEINTGFLSSGNHIYHWSPGNIANGVYLLQVESMGTIVKSEKVILIK